MSFALSGIQAIRRIEMNYETELHIPLEVEKQIDAACDDFEKAFRSNEKTRIEKFLNGLPENIRHFALIELIRLELALQKIPNIDAVAPDYHARFPDDKEAVNSALQQAFPKQPDPSEFKTVSPLSEESDFTAKPSEYPEHPKRIDRYEIKKVLGEGGFGRVYLAHDSDIDRPVALKVPTAKLFNKGYSVQTFLQEARSAAKVKHSGLITVYDVQIQADQPYIVQEYIQGTNLSDWLRHNKPSMQKIIELVIEIAEALVVVHQHDLVHRDLKPANILIDDEGHSHVADFGLALHSSWQFERKGEVAGTPAYMAPEQVRGESHRIDGRTDIWSLGVILYEMLSGQKPFLGKSRSELFDSIQYQDIRPPSQRNPVVSKELERICLTCLAKQKSDRYASTTHLLHDLRDWLTENSNAVSHKFIPTSSQEDAQKDTDRLSDTSSEAPQIVPKGLRSFDESDSDFFLDLLPGVRDKFGLPPSVSFWKSRIEETDGDLTFTVGVMYGPSGCGKSSLVKAGILPHLSNHVVSVYVEATPADTEMRLLKSLAKKVAGSEEGNTDLPTAIRRLRDQHESGQKVLIILDQFEQWLHGHSEDPSNMLIHALRHCDGGNVQCLILIRDDFWMPITRFMRQLEVELIENRTMKSVDRFSIPHAENVLTKFGRAYGSLPKQIKDKNREFISKSTAALAEDGRVICVRLSLFAQMMHEKPWTPKGLKAVGGIAGVGVTFLEETFSSSTASISHRNHQRAARAVLESLLPKSGTDIKGAMRSQEELVEASDYSKRPDSFSELLQILDLELRLITPTDPEGRADTCSEHQGIASCKTYYQLTHDYLVPSLRQWLTQKRKETRRGRAELRLAERTSHWENKPEKRHLPSSVEYLNIRAFTNSTKWSESQATVMRQAGWFHLTRAALLTAVLIVIGWISIESIGHVQTNSLISTLKEAKPEAIPDISTELFSYRRWAEPMLIALMNDDKTPKLQKLHARIALAKYDDSQIDSLTEELLTTTRPAYLECLRDAIGPHLSKQLLDDLWLQLRNKDNAASRRFHAGIALATYDSEHWEDADLAFVSKELIAFVAEYQPLLRNHFQPISERLLPHFKDLFADESLPASHRNASAAALADFADQNPTQLTHLLSTATPEQYKILFPIFADVADPDALQTLHEISKTQPNKNLLPNERIQLGRKRAGAAITMLRVGEREKIFDALRVTDDPDAMTQFIHRCRDRKVTPKELLECLKKADESRQDKTEGARRIWDRLVYTFILALGNYSLAELQLAKTDEDEVVNELALWLKEDPSSAIHGATSWLLRHWGKKKLVTEIESRRVHFSPEREWFTHEIRVSRTEEQYLYLTFVVFPSGNYQIGSSATEAHHDDNEQQHVVTISHDFAILNREITFKELTAFNGFYEGARKEMKYDQNHPGAAADWYDAVRFCRWLTQQIEGFDENDQCYPDEETAIRAGIKIDSNEYARGAPKNWPINLDRHGFRLPTEAEWEIGCRGGSMRGAFGFGNDTSYLSQYGYFGGRSNKRIQFGRLLRPNIRGLFDFHGNVMEWCHDWYADEYETSTNPLGPKSGSSRVMRGGGWGDFASTCRSAARKAYVPANRGTFLGFRVAQVPSALPAGDSAAEATAER